MTITDWASAGINWEKPQPASLYDALESIRLALLERMSVTGYDFANLSPIMKDIRMKSTYNVMSEFHSNISSAIANFAKHTDSGGNWDDKAVIPSWTEEDILEEIGDAERVQVSRLGFAADWIIQNYKILNLMKWSRFKFTLLPAMIERSTPYNTGYDWFKGSWGSTVSDFNNQDWHTYGYSQVAAYMAEHATFGEDEYYHIAASRGKASIPISKYHQCTKEFYYYGASTYYDVGPQTINNVSFHKDEYRYSLFRTESEGEGDESGEFFVFSDDDFRNSNLLEPKLSALSVSVNVIQSLVISKFDGANGFKFLETE